MATQAFEQVWKSITGVPASNFAGKQYTAVKYNANGKIVAAGAGEASIGILQEPNNVDEPAEVVASGFSFCILGDAVATGASMEVGTDGKLITLSAGKKVGTCAVGGSKDAIGTVFLDR